MSEDCVNKEFCRQCQEKYDQVNDFQNHRLDALEENIKKLHSLTTSVEKMAMSIEQMAKELEKQGNKLDEMEAEPAKKWKQAIWIIVTIIVTALVTHFMSHLGVG